MKRNKLKMIWILLLIIWITAIFFLVISLYFHQHPRVKVGQVWVKEYYADDPFKETIIDTIVIIDVKGDYAHYIEKSTGDTISNTKKWTIICARKIK